MTVSAVLGQNKPIIYKCLDRNAEALPSRSKFTAPGMGAL